MHKAQLKAQSKHFYLDTMTQFQKKTKKKPNQKTSPYSFGLQSHQFKGILRLKIVHFH